MAELVVEGDDDVSRARAIVESLGTPNSIVVHRAAVAATPEGRALLRRWDASPDVIHIGHDVDGARPNLKLIHDMTEMEGWIGMAARLRNSGAAPKHRGEELLLRSLKNVEQASSLRWQLLSSL